MLVDCCDLPCAGPVRDAALYIVNGATILCIFRDIRAEYPRTAAVTGRAWQPFRWSLVYSLYSDCLLYSDYTLYNRKSLYRNFALYSTYRLYSTFGLYSRYIAAVSYYWLYSR